MCLLITVGCSELTGEFKFTSDPDSAGVILDGEKLGMTPLTAPDLSYGSHSVVIEKLGYESIVDTISVKAPKSSRKFTLTAIAGILSVESTPQGAIIYLDGNTIGQNPPEGVSTPAVMEVQPGMHTISLKKDGYATYTESFTAHAGEKKTISATLAGLSAAKNPVGSVSAKIISEPDGAWVYIDGEKMEQITPAFYLVTDGNHQIKVSKPGYTSYEQEIRFPEESPLTVRLEKKTQGNLTVKSEPDDAKVLLNGNLKGRTPLTISDLTYGDYTIKVSKDGYPPVTDTVTIQGDERLVSYTLTTDKGIVRVRSIPTKASILVSNQIENYLSPETITLEPGTYTLMVGMQGYTSETKKVTLAAGDDISLEYVLTGPGGAVVKNDDGTIDVGITSEPEGASISIDGVKQDAKTPAIFTVTPGDHQVLATMLGFRRYDQEIAFPEESPLTVPLIVASSDYPDTSPASPEEQASLDINMDPVGAEVFVDGTAYEPPYKMTLDAGNHTIKASSSGYTPHEEVVSLQSGQNKVVKITLDPVPAPVPSPAEESDVFSPVQGAATAGLQITSIPSDSNLYVNDNIVGKTPYFKEVKARSYQLTLVSGNLRTTKTIDLSDGADKFLTVDIAQNNWVEAGIA